MVENAVQTTHLLDFCACPWQKGAFAEALLEMCDDDDEYPGIEWALFRVGTCEGQFRVTPEAYEILSIINDQPGNGHLVDVLEWFEYGCRESKLPLRILRFTNKRFKNHLIKKRGFHAFGKEDVEKIFLMTAQAQ